MVYHFVMLSDENDFFRREIHIDAEATFLELNNFILDSLSYSRAEMTTFYCSDEEWNKGQEVTLMDMGMGSEYDSYLMDATRLEELLEGKGDRLLFVYDMLSERALFMEIIATYPSKHIDSPVLLSSQGNAPEQTSTPEQAELRSVEMNKGGGFDADFLEEEELDLSELDPEGFTDLDSLEGY